MKEMCFNGCFKTAILFLYSIFLFPASGLAQKAAQDNAVDNFALLDQDGKFHELYYYSDKKAIVLISQGVGCPILRKYIPYLRQLKDTFEAQGVVFLMINANQQDGRESIKQESLDYGINIPILEDKSQVITESLNIKRVAQALVIDPANWKIVYNGAISSQFGYDVQITGTQHEYLKDAINAVLQQKPVPQSQTTVKGCLFNLAGSNHTDNPSYNKEVVPILLNRCVQCHVTGGSAPFSMDNYEKVKGWAPMIREVLRTKRMPPWQADPYYGKFKWNLSLSSEELRTLVHWVEQGARNEEVTDSLAKAPRRAPEGWVLGQPDVIFKFKEEQQIPAAGGDEYRYIETDKPVESDLYVRGIYWRPGNLKVNHHISLEYQMITKQGFVKNGGSEFGLDKKVLGSLIDVYLPGESPHIFPKGTGFFIPKGSQLFFRMHYIKTGKPERDYTQLGLYLYKNRPPHLLWEYWPGSKLIKIHPGVKEYKMRARYIFKNSVTLYALQPHMHLRGRSMRIRVEYPDGRSETLLSVPNYKYPWQRRYFLTEPKKLPAGSSLLIEGSYDNSAQNPDNPDPSKEVDFGPYGTDEMFYAFILFSNEKEVAMPLN